MLTDKCLSNNPRICVVGLGYVGLPLAIEFSKKYETVGFDINPIRVKELKTKVFDISVDSRFIEVIDSCAKITNTRRDTWINDTIKKLYIELYPGIGKCHCFLYCIKYECA